MNITCMQAQQNKISWDTISLAIFITGMKSQEWWNSELAVKIYINKKNKKSMYEIEIVYILHGLLYVHD